MTNLAEAVHLTMTFTRLPDGAAVRWESPVLGVRHSRFISPYRGETLALVVQALDLAQSLRNPQEVFGEEEQALLTVPGLWHPSGWIFPHAYQLVGRALFQALCDDPEGAQALGTVRDYATAENRPLALNLRMPPDAVELAALPWELLWDEGPVPLLLSRGRATACTRYLELTQAIPAPRPTHQAPLRILALAPQARIPPHVREEERQARHTAWKPLIESGQVIMEELGPVTREALVDALQAGTPPDVIHYYGHGEYNDGEGTLLLDAAHYGECWTSASALMALLGGVRMVTLFACQGAMVGQSSGQGNGQGSGLLTGVAPALSAAGIPIVLGMQFTVRVSAATRASGVMYRALAAGWSVQQAASLVRQALYVEENDRASWYVPVLYVRAHDTAPVCLLAPSEQRDTCTRPLSAAPPVTVTPAAPAARQSITARQNSRAGGIVMQGQAGAVQSVSATQHSTVERARMRAAGGSRQDIQAGETSEIVDVELEG